MAVECVNSFCVDSLLQTQLFKAGVLWHLLLFLFRYDFTLEEGGVERSAESNQQVSAPRHSRTPICIRDVFAKVSMVKVTANMHVGSNVVSSSITATV